MGSLDLQFIYGNANNNNNNNNDNNNISNVSVNY